MDFVKSPKEHINPYTFSILYHFAKIFNENIVDNFYTQWKAL